jgi:hypothetical protein
MFIHFFSCDNLVLIENYDQNSLHIKLHVILFVKMNGYVWCYFLMHSNNSIQLWNKIKQKIEI